MVDDIKNSEKIDILTQALGERYQAIHIIRQRVENLTLWTLGILFGLGTWLFAENITLDCLQKKLYVVAVLVAFCIFRYRYLKDLEKGFKKQMQVAASIEGRLGLYSPDFFGEVNEPVYPESWSNAGADDGEGKYFRTNYYLLYVGVVFLLVSILFN